ncbi:MAG TPA: hypothetical protein VLM76_04855 [Patescibacteria group bacterium]|nr:hypothetical protein [Patescibacteria group bacterium]
MRKFFASAFGLSLTAAIVLGVAFAWSASASRDFASQTGQVSIKIDDAWAGTQVVYDGGGWAHVMTGNFANITPANPGLPLQLTGGSITNITTPGHPGCAGLMSGAVNITGPSFVAPQSVGGGWAAFLRMDGDVGNACQNQVVNYTVNLVAGS